MCQLLTKILGEEIEKQNVIVQADDGQVGGRTVEETIDNWIRVLKLCSDNNLKINHKKVKILPDTSMIHGWEFKGGYVQPSPHRQLAILDIKQPKNIGEMRTYMGVYKTFFPAMEGLTNLMTPFDTLCGGKESKELINWTEELSKSFKESQRAAQTNIHKLALPHPDEQLFIVPDSCSRPPATGFILFVCRKTADQKQRAEPVMFVTWKLSDLHWKWSPCELEGLGASIAVDKCAFYILRSTKPTLVFPDNKQVIQAFNKLKKGRYSTSQRLATFTNNIQRYPVEMQHGSGKLLQNLGSDYIGRTTKECVISECSMCKFASERSNILLSTISNLVNGISPELELDLGSMTAHWCNALSNLKDLPIGNISAWCQLQTGDTAVSQAIKYKKSGQNPPRSNKSKEIKEIRYFTTNCKISPSSKLLVKEVDIPYDHKKQEKIVVPSFFLHTLLTQIHQDQSCPETNQLRKIFDRYFFGYRVNDIFDRISAECHKCRARQKIPKEIKHFTSITNSPGPGVVFVSDVMRRAKQFIFVTRDSFSDFVSTTLIKSESAEDLKQGLILTTSTVRRKSVITVRVDNAPGFVSLKKSADKDLAKLDIQIELSDPANKNGLAIADKAIQELEKELVRLSPEGKAVSVTELAQSTLALNSRIRNRDLSSHEILFSREQHSGENIILDDKNLANKKMEQKTKNHKYSENSKFRGCIDPSSAGAIRGDRVYLKEDGSKHSLRDLYVVTASDSKNVTLVKLLHAHDNTAKTKLGSNKIIVKQTDIYYVDSIRQSRGDELDETSNDVSNDEKETEEIKEKLVIIEKKTVWSPFPEEHLSDSDEDGTISLEEESFISSVNITENSTHTDDSGSGNILDMQFHQLQDLVDGLQDEPQYATLPEEHDQQPIAPTYDPGPQADHPLMSLSEEENVLPAEDENVGAGNDEEFVQHKPKKGDRIQFLCPKQSIWLKATLTSNGMKRYGGHYHNYKLDNGEVGGVNLIPGTAWTHAAEDVPDIREEVPIPLDSHNDAFDVGAVHNPLNTPFPEVQNLDDVLPLSSTPLQFSDTADASRSRLNAVRPRGFLPMEIDDSPLHRPSGSRIQRAMMQRADQVRKLLSKSSSDSST